MPDPQVLQHKLDKSAFGSFDCEHLRYLSVSWIGRDPFGHCRLQREILNAWLQKKLNYGSTFSESSPPLSSEEIKSVPGGEAVLTGLDSLKWEVLERNGTRMQIKQDEHRYWTGQTGEIGETYNALKLEHERILEATVGIGLPAEASKEEDAETGAGKDPFSKLGTLQHVSTFLKDFDALMMQFIFDP